MQTRHICGARGGGCARGGGGGGWVGDAFVDCWGGGLLNRSGSGPVVCGGSNFASVSLSSS